MKKLLIDTQAFQYLILQPKHHDQFRQLKQLVGKGDILIFGNISFLEELIGLSPRNSVDYKKVVKEYRIITGQKLLKPYNELIQMEIDNHAPLKQEEVFLSDEISKKIFDELENSFKLETLCNLIYNSKEDYVSRMMKAADSAQIKLLNGIKSLRETKKEVKSWLNNFDVNIRSWGKDMFDSGDKIDFAVLPHTASFISYFLIKIYQTTIAKHKHKSSDIYDCRHITEAAAADVFITEDNPLIRMYNLIPNKYRFVQLQKIDN